MNFQDILNKFRINQTSKRDLGTKFEELIARYLMTDPSYSVLFEWVKLWSDFSTYANVDGRDKGIDLVAKTHAGGYWAIQCKCYAADYVVSKKDVDTFLSASGKKFTDKKGVETSFSQRAIIATTNNWGDNARDMSEGQTIPVTFIGLNILENAPVKWDEIEHGAHGKTARKEKYELRPHQQEAFDNAISHYKSNDRGSMIMACGTGKTFTSLRIAEALSSKGNNCVLFLAPSIALIGQTLREWTANAQCEINAICVCSDPKISKRYIEDDVGERVEDLGMPATTDSEKIVEQYKSGNGPVVVFSTYQSIDAVSDAQKAGLPEFDIIICDEAHRTTGVIEKEESSFTKVHDNKNIKGKKRLYMTATPRLYGAKGKEDAAKESVLLCSMDDENLYGKEFYKITFGKAVELELLSDYRVLILTIADSSIPEMIKKYLNKDNQGISVDDDCKIWGCLNALAKNLYYDADLKAIDPEPMKSAVAFTRTISRSKTLAERFNKLSQTKPGSPINLLTDHIDGSMNAMKRDQLMTWLKAGNEKQCRMLSNVRCLSEGVDVPALDAVMFMDSKGSLIDVVQSVGRVMRKSPGKKYGYIVIPIVIPDNEDPESALDDNERYKVVWQVLRALRSHDERLDAEINTLFFRKKTSEDHIHITRPMGGHGDDPNDYVFKGGQFTLDEFGMALMARLVLKVGDREYVENWARNVATVMPSIMEKLELICGHSEHGYKQYRPAFNRYLKGLRACVNDDVSEKDAINMLAQQIVTKPIFEALFGDDRFTTHNPVSQTIDAMLEEIDAKNGLKDVNLTNFHEGVERTLSRIETADGKQRVITSLYEKFFKNAFPKDQTINGVVYTPPEIVDFIICSAAGVLKKEFGLDMSGENVNILDPFTGTGTFIARLMELGIIKKEDLERKYRNELFANEITLLAYYIAAVNIENTFTKMSGKTEYVQFGHILLTDTFNMSEICKGHQTTLGQDEYFKKNIGRIKEEQKTPITVIIGNPPYGANQKSANDDAKKRTYRGGVDGEIEKKYLDDSLFTDKKGNVNSVYDNYIRAFRWSTDRIGNKYGIVAFVTPNGWLTGSAFVGFRKCIEKEFSKIYIFNLRGDQNRSNWREEGEKVFGQGSKVGISITLLVKHENHKGKAKVLYAKTKDYMRRQEKLDLLTQSKSFSEMESKNNLEILNVKENGDWIIERNESFQKLIPIAGDTRKKFDDHSENTLFVGYSRGYATSRDGWAYNYSEPLLKSTKEMFIEGYNEQLIRNTINYGDKRVKWTTVVKNAFNKKQKLSVGNLPSTVASFRPFMKIWFDCDDSLNESSYLMRKIYPASNTKNLLICVAGVGVKKDFSCLMTNKMTDIQLMANGQCFPLHWYEDSAGIRVKNKQSSLFGEAPDLIRHDGISDYALEVARSKYGNSVTKEEIFFYIYGYLHSPEYRTAFAEDLKLSLPRIDFVETKEDFIAFSNAGRSLAELHLNYEKVEAPSIVKLGGNLKIEDILGKPNMCNVKKMKLLQEDRKIIYNDYITIENIPEEAFDYVVNGRSALGWIVDQYQYSVDKDSGIVNDPNEYAGGEYVLKLTLSIIGVSVETMKIVNKLPKI